MADYYQSRKSGTAFEQQLIELITRYTSNVWNNIRIETLLTQSGTTEVDIIFCFQDVVFMVEAKNVSSIIGSYGDKQWAFIGASSQGRETKEYTKLNVITQNNIHVRSFKDLFFAHFQEWPAVIPVIVVPSFCMVSDDISSVIYTVSDLNNLLTQVSKWDVQSKIQRRVAALMTDCDGVLRRPDFMFNEQLKCRMKMQ